MTVDTQLRHLGVDDIARLRPASLFDLSGRVAVVTGAGGGLGTWLSAGMAAAGAHVVLADYPRPSLEEPLATIEAGGGSADALHDDLLEDDAPQRRSFTTGQTVYVDGGWLAGTPWSSPAG